MLFDGNRGVYDSGGDLETNLYYGYEESLFGGLFIRSTAPSGECIVGGANREEVARAV